MDNSSPEPPQSSPDTSISRKHRSGPTREDLSFYPSTGDDVRKILEKGLANHRITPGESELIDEFLLEEGARRSWSLSRKIKLASTLVTAREWFPPYHETILSDIYRGFDRLKDAKSQKQRRYKQNSIRDFYIAIKQFFTWLIEHKIVNINQSQLARIKTPSRDQITKTTDNILKPEETAAVIDACTNSADRAIFLTWYEAGLRPNEVAKMVWRDLIFHPEQNLVKLHVISKTKYPRVVPLFLSYEALLRLREDYPYQADPDSLVFVNARGEPFTHAALAKKMQRWLKKAGVSKRVSPHGIRHTRITDLSRGNSVPESFIRQMMWGNQNTSELATYTHLSEEDDTLFAAGALGMDLEKESDLKKKTIKMVVCSVCGSYFPPYFRSCKNCNHTLDKVHSLDTNDLMKVIDTIPSEKFQELNKFIGTPEYNQIYQEVEQ